MRARLILDTVSDVTRFVEITKKLKQPITVTDGNGLKVNAKSLMGMYMPLNLRIYFAKQKMTMIYIWR